MEEKAFGVLEVRLVREDSEEFWSGRVKGKGARRETAKFNRGILTERKSDRQADHSAAS